MTTRKTPPGRRPLEIKRGSVTVVDELIVWCQGLEGRLELLFSGSAYFVVHAGSLGGGVGHPLTNQHILFWVGEGTVAVS